jgi:hypothetical protein
MTKSVVAVAVGLLVAAILIGLVELAGRFVVLPTDVDPFDPESIRLATADPPPGALLFVLFGWGVGTVCGCWLSVVLARKSPFYHSLPVGGLLLIAGLVEMFAMPHPVWFRVLGIAVFVLSTFAGCGLGQHYAKTHPPAELPSSTT